MRGAKLYNREELLDRAIELFRWQGFSATSTAELVKELGVNRKSMYAEFGSKQELFEAALERYSEQNLTRVLAPIEADDADADSIRTAFEDHASASKGAFSGLGCLMCNTAVERAALDPGSGRFVDTFLKRLTDDFRNALGNARRKGQVADGADLNAMAAFFAMSLVGISALIRAKAAPEQVQSASEIAVAVLDFPD